MLKIGRIRVQTSLPVELVSVARTKGIKYSFALAHGIRKLSGEEPDVNTAVLQRKIELMSRVIDSMRERMEMQGEQLVSIRNRI